VNAIGYDLYCQMLREAISESRGEEPAPERMPVKMDVEIDAYLPEEYIDDPDQRILFYKRLADLAETDALRRLSEELVDRYGRLPEPARHLLKIKELRVLAEAAGVGEMSAREGSATIRFVAGREPRPDSLREMVRLVPGKISFRADGREGLRVVLEARDLERVLEGVEALLRVGGASVSLAVS
jgi:transcription-repair coupling factor (superfamily II helicase)